MARWPIGVFASVDAGLGVHLDVAQELGIPTVQVHAPHQQTRTPQQAARSFSSKCTDAGITVTCVFGGFEGESYADIPTTARTVGLVPEETRAARVQEMKEISDFAKLLGCDCRRPAHRLCSGRHGVDRLPGPARCDARSARSCGRQRSAVASGDRAGDGRASAGVHRQRRAGQPVHQLRPGQHDPLRHGRPDRRPQEGGASRQERPLQRRQLGCRRRTGQVVGSRKSPSAKETSAWRRTCKRSKNSATTAR